MKRTVIYFVLIWTGSLAGLNAQDPQFSQFYNNMMYYNPATVGLTQDFRVTSTYRRLWKNIPGDLSSSFFTIDHQISNINTGLGFLMLNNSEGTENLRNQRFELFYSYRIPTGQYSILQMGMTVFSLNVSDFTTDGLVFSDQLDPVHGDQGVTSFVKANEDPKVYPDWNIGIVFKKNFIRNRHYFLTPTVGYSWNHITRPNVSLVGNDEIRLESKHVVHFNALARMRFRSNNKMKRKEAFINPGIIYETQGPFKTMSLGSSFEFFPLRFGIWFRNNPYESSEILNYNSVIILAGCVIPLVLNHNLIIDYTYDSTVSSLEFSSGGAHEVSLLYNISLPEKKRQADCPDFTEWWRPGRGLSYYNRK